ncbi:hypothetical protein [Jeotgalibacillus campisalis]|uniref:Sigma-X negative effector n=1 Tax=Jeotgalibacillus campisalis TaxID=220754 RepID=A0A0C2S264_9BACL|nr:hypothetical protein [Jeotgalibacillus campisalis]KIL48099.1 hypothetical protein KR50_22660 [Jeotgalibacillus campisalis]
MSGSKWNNKDIEEMLNKMPNFKNRQTAEMMYKKIKLKESKKNKRRTLWIPGAASAAVLMLLFLLISPFLNSNNEMNISSDNEAVDSYHEQTTEESAEDSHINSLEEEKTELTIESNSSDEAEDENPAIQEQKEKPGEENSSNEAKDHGSFSETEPADESKQFDENLNATIFNATVEEQPQGTALYSAEASGRSYFKTALVSWDGYVIPFTFLLPEKENEDSSIELYNRWADEIDEEAIGFSDYHPVTVDLSTPSKDSITGTIDNFSERIKESSFDVLNEVLKQTFGHDNYRLFKIANGEGEFEGTDSMGGQDISLNNKNKGYYLYRDDRTSNVYFAQSYASFATIEDALKKMQQEVPNGFTKVLPENITIETQQENDLLTITPSKQINDFTDEEKKNFIEAVLLTAASFGMQEVLFENISDSRELGFDLEKPIVVPLGPNKQFIR